MKASYTKLKSGSWGVRVEGTVKAGQTVTVTKKDGTTKTEKIVKVVWSGNGVSLCALETKPTAVFSGSLYGRRTGCSCGSIEGIHRESDCWTCRHDY